MGSGQSSQVLPLKNIGKSALGIIRGGKSYQNKTVGMPGEA